jgi:proline iminopeptidase
MHSSKEFTLIEESGHVIAFSEYGNPKGIPILSFHGGPGGKSKPEHAERFDLSKYRIILFDQRGCGKSTPSGNLQENTTQHILKDAERIRIHFQIQKWHVSGSSFGATCALLYAIEHPNRTSSLLLSSTFLADKDSVDWAMHNSKGAARFMPEAWTARMNFFSEFGIRIEKQNEDLLQAFKGACFEKQQKLAAGVLAWETKLLSISPIPVIHFSKIQETDIGSVKISLHFAQHHYFIQDNYILKNAYKIKDIPGICIHGRYDLLCPIEKSFTLQKHMPLLEYIVAPSSGHCFSTEGEIIRSLSFKAFLEKIDKN